MHPIRLRFARSFALSVLCAASLGRAAFGQEPRLANLSTRAQTGPGANVLTAGFVIGPGTNKQILVRAVGPGLGSFGLSGLLPDPVLTIIDSNGATVASNDNWNAGDAATFSAVGAFALTPGSKDSAIVTTLQPGPYTAQVTGATGTSASGLALVEVYEVSGTGTKLVNISTRAQVGTGANVMIPGIVIGPGGGTRRLLVRAAGPALGGFGVAGTLADPTISLSLVTGSGSTTLATNDNWGTPVGTGAADATTLAAAFTQAGAFQFPAGSQDSALIADIGPGNYGISVSGVGGTSGIALVEVYDITPVTSSIVTIAATKPTADETGSNNGEFTVTRSGDTLTALTVNYGVSGSATNAIDYPALLGTVVIPAGQSSVKIPLNPFADTTVEDTETCTLTLAAGSGYTIGSASSATVSIADSPSTLYVANLRPASGATGSSASGLATITLSASGTVATVNVTFSNLSSAEAGAHLFLGNSTSTADYIFALPMGQVNNIQWNIQPTASHTVSQIIDALRSGQIFFGLDTGNYPSGELRGSFLSAIGSQNFTAPGAPPSISLSNITATDAARLLMQGTFGARKSEIDALTGGGIDAWITAQMAQPASHHRPAELAEYAAEQADAKAAGQDPNQVSNTLNDRRHAWHQVILAAPDQLRQRVAFALSQILVVSDDPFGNGQAEGLANYYDLLVDGAFGNFRTLLNNVTLNPIMGNYLSSVRNAKADPVAGTFPDENYAREVMQLFSIGLVQLQPDGTLKLDSQGLPIPTYDNTVIPEMAKVFTGWGYYTTKTNPPFRTGPTDYIDAMMLYPAYHDDTEKHIVNGVVIPASQGGTKDLQLALDALFNHPNCGPFVCRQLIQRLVTDNPSPSYVYRVSQVFANNGSGTRGDLAAVVRAILEDYEARSPVVYDDPGYGKLREPLLRYTALVRGFSATSGSGRNVLNVDPTLEEGALESPTVFNFYQPGYVYPGALAQAGLVAPEFEITDDTSSIAVPNFLRSTVFATATGNNADKTYVLNLGAEQGLATSNPSALLDELNLVLCGGQMTSATRTRILSALGSLSSTTTALERAQSAILLVATSPDGATQR